MNAPSSEGLEGARYSTLSFCTYCVVHKVTQSYRDSLMIQANTWSTSLETGRCSGVTRGKGGRDGSGPPLVTGDTRMKKMLVNLQRIVDKRGRTGKKSAGSVCQEKVNRGDTAELTDRQTVMTKKVVSFFRKKIGVTPSVAAPGDTNPIVTPLGRCQRLHSYSIG